MRTVLASTTIALVALAAPPRAAAPNWHLTATVAESCSCTVSCPCNFGGEPSRMPCEGNRLIAITSGKYEDVDLAGVAFLVTFNMRNWSKIYVSDKSFGPSDGGGRVAHADRVRRIPPRDAVVGQGADHDGDD